MGMYNNYFGANIKMYENAGKIIKCRQLSYANWDPGKEH